MLDVVLYQVMISKSGSVPELLVANSTTVVFFSPIRQIVFHLTIGNYGNSSIFSVFSVQYLIFCL